MQCEITTIDDPRWASFVDANPQASAFHCPAWASLLQDYYGYRAFVAFMAGESGEVVAGLPIMDVRSRLTGRKWVALPFSDYCYALTTHDDVLTVFFERLDALRSKEGVALLEVRWPIPAPVPVVQSSNRLLHVLDLSGGAQAVFDRFEKKTRQYVRRAEKEGLRLLAGEGEADMDIAYDLHVKTRARLGAPVQPRKYFHLLGKRLILPGAGHVILVGNSGGIPVAAAVVLSRGKKAMIKYSASDPAYLGQRSHYLLFWKTIEWACENGMQEIDFGRCELTETGLRHFKMGWSPREIPLAYSFLGAKGRALKPDHWAGFLRPVLKHSPAWVGRVVGQLLYRYSA